MPTYDYRCDANGQTVEVRHGMTETISTWSELCERAGMSPGETPSDTPVYKLATGGQVVKSSALKNPEAPACGNPGGCCGGGMCGMGG